MVGAMARSSVVTALQEQDSPLDDTPLDVGDGLGAACGEEPGMWCEAVFDATGNELLAKAADFLVARPLRIVFIIVLTWVANRLVRRAIRRFAERVERGESKLTNLRGRTPAALQATGGLSLRSAARAQTIAAVLRSTSTGVIYGIAAIYIAGALGLSLGPLIAGAGVVGVALGFGAQGLVRDFLSGIFMLVEDQYGVGDIVDLGVAPIGTVEAVSLRVTRLRDLEGTVWHVPNGQILRVGNSSQIWARALLDVDVAYGTDLRQAQAVIKQVADELWRDPDTGPEILEEPEMWGVQSLGAAGITLRLVIKTRPGQQWKVTRELRLRLSERFDQEGIEIPFSQNLWIRQQDGDLGDALGAPNGGGSGAGQRDEPGGRPVSP